MKLWKILLPVTLCLVLALLFLPTTANAASSGTCGNNVTWTLNDAGTLTISGSGPMKNYDSYSPRAPWYYSRSSVKKVVIAYRVTTIGDLAFSGCDSLTSVTIGNSVTTIGEAAFSSCTSLTGVTIPDSVTTIGEYAFSWCDSLTGIWVDANNPNYSSDSNGVLFNKNKTTLIQAHGAISGSYTIPDSVTTIGDYAFYDCSSLTSVTIPDSVTTIGEYAFSWCDSLSSVTIGNSVTTIGEWAFYSCDSLTGVTIPGSVTTIGYEAFHSCHSLTGIWVDADNPNYSSDSKGVLFNKNKTILIQAPGVIASYTIPNSVTTIGDEAFSGCTSLTGVTIPDSVTAIGDDAFSSCHSLSSVTIGNSVTTIDNGAFLYCDSLTDVWYTGSQADRQKIRIGPNNSYLISATWHYDACPVGAEHTYDNTCDTECNVCGKTRTITHNYQWIIDQQENCGVDGIKHEECTVCQTKRNEGTAIPATGKHTYGNSCDTECNVCKQIRTIEHTYDNACDTECNVCKQIRSIEHTYDNACDTICNICKFERTVPPHSYTRNGNHTCDICKYSKTPGRPVVESKTNNSVTLVKTEGFEYSKDGKSWQTSNVFANLAPDTTYTFYQRVKASSVALVSETSESLSVTFKSAQTAPSAPMISSFTDTTLTLIPITIGEYSLDGKIWQTDSVFYDLTPGTKYTVYQRYAETDAHEASNASAGTAVTMDKSKQTQIPDAPTVESVTANSVTLVAVDGCEYSKNGRTWQTSNVFISLSSSTEYTFYQRYKETATTRAGESSQGLTVKTEKGPHSRPAAPTLASKTHNTVTLVAVDGCEYSRDGINWQASNVFTGLAPETNYFFYQRKAETATHYASEISPSLIVKTNEEPDYIPGDLNGNEQLTTDDAVYLLLSVMFGAEDYPVPNGMPLDFNSDSKLDTNDAVYLLLHVMFGAEDYPLSA